jgi:hypothetical protein
MSADNRICILRLRESLWAVWDGNASTDYAEPPEGTSLFSSEMKAIDAAHKMARDTEDSGYLEYGIEAITVEEQESALKWVIEDAKQRLKSLKKVGYQCPWYL